MHLHESHGNENINSAVRTCVADSYIRTAVKVETRLSAMQYDIALHKQNTRGKYQVLEQTSPVFFVIGHTFNNELTVPNRQLSPSFEAWARKPHVFPELKLHVTGPAVIEHTRTRHMCEEPQQNR